VWVLFFDYIAGVNWKRAFEQIAWRTTKILQQRILEADGAARQWSVMWVGKKHREI
jgi:hypothetical protein